MKISLRYFIYSKLFVIMVITSWPVSASELSCEEARENLIAPLREAKIKECQSDSKNDPDWCVRFYSTYGDATPRPGGGVNPRMFDDIPECRPNDK